MKLEKLIPILESTFPSASVVRRDFSIEIVQYPLVLSLSVLPNGIVTGNVSLTTKKKELHPVSTIIVDVDKADTPESIVAEIYKQLKRFNKVVRASYVCSEKLLGE